MKKQKNEKLKPKPEPTASQASKYAHKQICKYYPSGR